MLVSEFMLQQTPVARVLGPYAQWLQRWPTPAALAADAPGEAVRAWGRLGYPRRALRLHATARVLVERHDGVVPEAYEDLRALPGVGDYTAAAVASFAFGARHVVLDVNVRRVLARAVAGRERPGPTLTAAERTVAEAILPPAATAAKWAAATMELGATVCTSRAPDCGRCPIRSHCAWWAAGRPEDFAVPRRTQAWAGTDRQARGALLAVLRAHDGPVPEALLAAAWSEPIQRERALAGLIVDGLLEVDDDLPRPPPVEPANADRAAAEAVTLSGDSAASYRLPR